MNNSKEDLLELTQFTPAVNKKITKFNLKKRSNNKVHSPFHEDVPSSSKSTDEEIAAKFSVKKKFEKNAKKNTESEISDDILSENTHFAQENVKIESNVVKIRHKLQKNATSNSGVKNSFWDFHNEEIEEILHRNDELTHYFPAAISLVNFADLIMVKNQNFPHSPMLSPISLNSLKSDLKTYKGDCLEYFPGKVYTENLQEVVVTNRKEFKFELTIFSLKFFHHPLFSYEHVLARKLEKTLQEFEETKKNCEENFEAMKLRNFKRRYREKWLESAKIHKTKLKSILELWGMIKKLRASQNYANTRCRLKILKKNLNLDEEKLKFDQFFEEIFHQVLEERRKKFAKKNSTLIIDETELKRDLKTKFTDSVKSPEESELNFLLIEEENLQNAEINIEETEKMRRKIASSVEITLKILHNGIEVLKTMALKMNEEFFVDFNETFFINFQDFPEFLIVEIYEHSKETFKKRKIADIKLKIHPENEKINAEFENSEILHYNNKNAAVGSGRNFQILNDEMAKAHNFRGKFEFEDSQILNTRGILSCKIIQSGPNNEEIIEIDEANFVEFEKVQNIELDDFRFYDLKFLDKNLRFQYLKLRNLHEIEFDGVKIPNRIREISYLGLMKDFEKRKFDEENLEIKKNLKNEEEDFEELLENGKKRLIQIYRKLFFLCKNLNNSYLNYESVVDERNLVFFSDFLKILLRRILNWFKWRPQKVQKPLPRKIINKTESVVKKNSNSRIKLQIKILQGANFPQKSTNSRFFLEISFEDLIVETSTAQLEKGAWFWSEFIEFPLKSFHADYLNSEALKGSISIKLYDLDEENFHNFLGEVKIPLNSFTSGLGLFGWFKIDEPMFSSNYHRENSQNCAFLQLEIGANLNIPILAPNLVELPSNETPSMKERLIKWNNQFNENFPNKKFSVFAMDHFGRTNCIIKYFSPVDPPQIKEDFQTTVDQCLKFVSLINFTDFFFGPFYRNIWLNSQQFLEFFHGSIIDHCVTLTCFLTALKMDAYLILGFGIPHGANSAYVLLKEFNRELNCFNYSILDPFYNEKFHIGAEFCPLQRIYCVANNENIWGNAQRSQTISELRFDFERLSDWWPLFRTDFLPPSNFIYSNLRFSRQQDDFDDLELILERKIKRKFSKWRSTQKTNFNLRLAKKLKNFLKLLENASMHGKPTSDILLELQKITNQEETIKGIILNLNFTNFSTISKKIKSLKVHLDATTSEFILSVYLHNYPGEILSFSIFLGRIFEK